MNIVKENHCIRASCKLAACALAVWNGRPGKAPVVAVCKDGVCGSAAYVYGM